jgi:hypothetical protein
MVLEPGHEALDLGPRVTPPVGLAGEFTIRGACAA